MWSRPIATEAWGRLLKREPELIELGKKLNTLLGGMVMKKDTLPEPYYEETWRTKILSLVRYLAVLTLLSAAAAVMLIIILPIMLWGAKGLLIQLAIVVFLVTIARSIRLIDHYFENIYISQHGQEAANAYKQNIRWWHLPTAVP